MLNTSDRSVSRIVSPLTEQGLVRSASRVALPLARPRPMAE